MQKNNQGVKNVVVRWYVDLDPTRKGDLSKPVVMGKFEAHYDRLGNPEHMVALYDSSSDEGRACQTHSVKELEVVALTLDERTDSLGNRVITGWCAACEGMDLAQHDVDHKIGRILRGLAALPPSMLTTLPESMEPAEFEQFGY